MALTLAALLFARLSVAPSEETVFSVSGCRIPLTEEELVECRAANAGLGIVIGEIGESSKSVVGEGVATATTTSFSSEKTGTIFESGEVGVLLFLAASLARFPKVGTLVAEPAFFTSIGLAVTFRATMELLLSPSLGTWGICGVLELEFVEEAPGVLRPDLTLTTLACALKACWAGMGGTIASPW